MGDWNGKDEEEARINRKAAAMLEQQERDRAEAAREKERRRMSEVGEANLFAMVKPSMGQRRGRVALSWLLADDLKRWALVGILELIIGIIAYFMIASNPFIWFIALPLLLIPFAPYLYVTYLLKSRKAIFFPAYKGEGYLWQRKSKELGANLELLFSLSSDPDATKHTKVAYAKMEPLVWNDLVKANRLMNKRKKYNKVDADAIESINKQYRTLNTRGRDLEDIIVACNSLEVLEVDFDLDSGNAHDVIKGVRDGIKQQRELSAVSIELEG